jgi:hypothetical protein
MKFFTITKTGYTAGVYGCSGEYFTCIICNDENITGFAFYGLYGAEERIKAIIEDMGYNFRYVRSYYGQLKQKDGKGSMKESEAITYIEKLKNQGQI